jgi:glycosyltransferase involved in cell wall biosynthesis
LSRRPVDIASNAPESKCPLVSVVLSVHNGGTDLPRAIETMMAQTFSDFELIAINNGSTDGSAAVLDGLSDPRVRVFHQENLGLAAALNRGLALSRGRYIARQDHDDWAAPTRLAKQVAVMEQNPDLALLGTRAEIYVGDEPSGRSHDHPVDDAALRFELLFDNPFVHSSVMIRKAVLEEVGGYCTDPARQPPEDYELWSRIARRHRLANLAERLMIYREVRRSMSRTGANPFGEHRLLISAENLAFATGQPRPGPEHFDTAALIQLRYDRLSQRPDIDGMCAVVQKAGTYIHAAAPESDVLARTAARIRRLRHEFTLLTTGLHRVRPLLALAARARSAIKAATSISETPR